MFRGATVGVWLADCGFEFCVGGCGLFTVGLLVL